MTYRFLYSETGRQFRSSIDKTLNEFSDSIKELVVLREHFSCLFAANSANEAISLISDIQKYIKSLSESDVGDVINLVDHLEEKRMNTHLRVFLEAFEKDLKDLENAKEQQKMCWYCGRCKSDTGSLKMCGGCDQAKYCNDTCQRNHWHLHKKWCCSKIKQ
jgi:hypothetical protein